jgi:uncharacterized protein (DUF736 family)
MEQRNNSGAIFKNDNKKAENHPDYKGKVLVNGKEMEVALWVKTSAKGVNYFSASFSEPFVKNEPQITGTLKQTIIHESNFDNDDLPF